MGVHALPAQEKASEWRDGYAYVSALLRALASSAVGSSETPPSPRGTCVLTGAGVIMKVIDVAFLLLTSQSRKARYAGYECDVRKAQVAGYVGVVPPGSEHG